MLKTLFVIGLLIFLGHSASAQQCVNTAQTAYAGTVSYNGASNCMFLLSPNGAARFIVMFFALPVSPSQVIVYGGPTSAYPVIYNSVQGLPASLPLIINAASVAVSIVQSGDTPSLVSFEYTAAAGNNTPSYGSSCNNPTVASLYGAKVIQAPSGIITSGSSPYSPRQLCAWMINPYSPSGPITGIYFWVTYLNSYPDKDFLEIWNASVATNQNQLLVKLNGIDVQGGVFYAGRSNAYVSWTTGPQGPPQNLLPNGFSLRYKSCTATGCSDYIPFPEPPASFPMGVISIFVLIPVGLIVAYILYKLCYCGPYKWSQRNPPTRLNAAHEEVAAKFSRMSAQVKPMEATSDSD